MNRYGYIPDDPDPRDYAFRAPMPHHAMPPSAVLPKDGQPVLDQGDLGSCVLNATAGNILYHQPSFLISRLWAYYKTRVMERTTKEDAGCQIRDAVKVVAKLGAPPEADWPYDTAKFATRPPAKAYKDAKREVILKYERIATPTDARACIAAGNPVLVGFTLFESFESDAVANTGKAPMPGPREREIGGHCVLWWGYDPTHDEFLNSWSDQWGDKGYFKFPRAYADDPDLCSDMWSITACEQTGG